MNKLILNTICFALLAVSCQDVKFPEKPNNLISKDTMELILIDAYLLNAAQNLNKQVIKKNKVAPDSLIYKKYGIDSLQFAKSNAYYALNNATYTQLLENVQSELQLRKERLDTLLKKHEAEKKKIEKERKIKLKDSFTSVRLHTKPKKP